MDSVSLKSDFPIFKYHPDLVYLDSTATSLKPKSVIDKVSEYYEQYSANVFRGVYEISEKATEEYEQTRKILGNFINSKKTEEIILTRSTTESINLVAYSLGRKIINEGDEIVTTVMEHHSNFVPWQQLALENGATFKVIDVTDDGFLDLFLPRHPEPIRQAQGKLREESSDQRERKNASLDSSVSASWRIPQNDISGLDKIITKKTKFLAIAYVSNVLGTINPIKKIVKMAKSINPKLIVIVDAAQAVPHLKVDVQDLGCDFLTFSSHKMLGPTGVGALWGRYELLSEMFPFNFGGEMIQEVYVDKTVFKPPPHKFEAGTPDIAGVIALKEAIIYLQKIGMDKVRSHERELLLQAFKRLKSSFGEKIQILGPPNKEDKGGIIAFKFGNYHPHDVAQILDEEQICVRAGHHCAMPLHQRFGINASVRASFYIYNTEEDVDKLVRGLKKVEDTLG
ncbi:aminotransferase class V-fold PLP-dependent enzyme [Candidatus Roizmanbacteria bacterium]|nr:aminotransferase class V-fold PLP-dependent enzyme [Candidatus Roizmanbacteria bacterium]